MDACSYEYVLFVCTHIYSTGLVLFGGSGTNNLIQYDLYKIEHQFYKLLLDLGV